LKGISTGDFEDALAALVGKDAPGLSASTIARLKSLPSRKRGAVDRGACAVAEARSVGLGPHPASGAAGQAAVPGSGPASCTADAQSREAHRQPASSTGSARRRQ